MGKITIGVKTEPRPVPITGDNTPLLRPLILQQKSLGSRCVVIRFEDGTGDLSNHFMMFGESANGMTRCTYTYLRDNYLLVRELSEDEHVAFPGAPTNR